MRQSYQAEESKLSLLSKTLPKLYESSNVIKVTPSGYESLTNSNQWGIFKDEFDKNALNSHKNKSKLVLKSQRTENGTMAKIQNPRIQGILNSLNKTVSRKALRAHQSWTKSQQIIHQNIEKQLQRRQNEKLKQYQWVNISSKYKNDITEILNQWDYSMLDQKDRLKKRLKQIYYRKYAAKNNQNQNPMVTRKSKLYQHKSMNMEGEIYMKN